MAKEITVKELCTKYNKSISYFTTILCRPEFNQFRITDKSQRGGNKYIYNDCINFHKMLVFFLEKKNRNGHSNAISNVEIINDVITSTKKNKGRISWTPSTIECYKRGCICLDCQYSQLSEKCQMKYIVMELIRKDIKIPHVANTQILE